MSRLKGQGWSLKAGGADRLRSWGRAQLVDIVDSAVDDENEVVSAAAGMSCRAPSCLFDKHTLRPYHLDMLYKRANFLINKRFQLKFSFFICSWIFALSMVYPIIIYNLFEYFLKVASDPALQGGTLTLEKVKGIESQVLLMLGGLQLLFLLITFLISIFISHRIAGPLYKLRKSMEEVARGNFDLRIAFRKNDHFMELQETFNEMIQHLSIRRWR